MGEFNKTLFYIIVQAVIAHNNLPIDTKAVDNVSVLFDIWKIARRDILDPPWFDEKTESEWDRAQEGIIIAFKVLGFLSMTKDEEHHICYGDLWLKYAKQKLEE